MITTSTGWTMAVTGPEKETASRSTSCASSAMTKRASGTLARSAAVLRNGVVSRRAAASSAELTAQPTASSVRIKSGRAIHSQIRRAPSSRCRLSGMWRSKARGP